MAQIKTIKNKPEILSLTSKGKLTFLSWAEADGAEKYIIKRSKKCDCEFKKIGEVPFGTTSFEDSSIAKEGLYWYRITAYRDMGEAKPLSKNGEAKSINITTISAPVATSIKIGKGKSVTFSWQDEGNVDGYIILRRHSFMKRPLKIATADKNLRSFTDTDFTFGPTYCYSVEGYVGSGVNTRYSPRSNEVSISSLPETKITLIKRKHFKKVSFSARLTTGAEGYILFSSDKKNGDFKEAAKTKGFDNFVLSHKAEKGANGAFYCVCAYKTVDGKEIYGPKTEPVYVKYKL